MTVVVPILCGSAQQALHVCNHAGLWPFPVIPHAAFPVCSDPDKLQQCFDMGLLSTVAINKNAVG